jgi:acetyltransferase-like isoleucine patch superfamily enzyme
MLHRLRGVQIHGRVFIGDDVYLENEYPENVVIHEGAQICLRSIVLAHSHGLGRIVIEQDAFVGAACLLLATPGRTLTIGSGAVVTAGSVVTSDVPCGVLYGAEKPKTLAKANVPLGIDTPFEEFLAGLRPHGRPAPSK